MCVESAADSMDDSQKRGIMQKLEDFGKRISECRQNLNMTQEMLAGRIGVTPQALSKWERGD